MIWSLENDPPDLLMRRVALPWRVKGVALRLSAPTPAAWPPPTLPEGATTKGPPMGGAGIAVEAIEVERARTFLDDAATRGGAIFIDAGQPDGDGEAAVIEDHAAALQIAGGFDEAGVVGDGLERATIEVDGGTDGQAAVVIAAELDGLDQAAV